MTAGIYNIKIECGVTFSEPFDYTDDAGAIIDLTGYTARMKIRPTKASATVYVSLTHAAGITLAATSPNVTITISMADTAALQSLWAEGDPGKYDLEIFSGGVGDRLLEGTATISHEVSY